ncbi:MAG: hypothetical protein HQ541_13730 [Mariniphaga sp.]|nr:hypothetical protein [Mariniphaga sp.]
MFNFKILILSHENNYYNKNEIAEEFAVNLSTIKSHVNNIYSKLGISSRKEILDVG